MNASPLSVINFLNQPMTLSINRLFSQLTRRCCRVAFYTTIALIFSGIFIGVLLGLLITSTLYRLNPHSEFRSRSARVKGPVILSTVNISSKRKGPSSNASKQVKADQLTRKLGLGSKEEFSEIKRENTTKNFRNNSRSDDDFVEFSPYFVQAPPLRSRGKASFSFGGGSTTLLSDGSEDWKFADSNHLRGVYGYMSAKASREIRQSFSDDSDNEAREDQPLLSTRNDIGFDHTAELSPNSQIEFYSRFRLPPDPSNNPHSEDINADGYTISPRYPRNELSSSNQYFLSIN